MTYKTIRQKAHEAHERANKGTCLCGQRLNLRNIKRYLNQYGEYVPICLDCAKIVKEFLVVV